MFAKPVLLPLAAALSLVACGDPSDGQDGQGKLSSSSASSKLPQGMAGSWYAGRGGTTVPYNPDTGSYGTPNGSALVYIFRDDGSYTKAFQSFVGNGRCSTGFIVTTQGTVQYDGKVLVTTPTRGQKSFRDTCAPSLDSDEPLGQEGLGAERFTAKASGNSLTLTRDDGASSEFQRIDDRSVPFPDTVQP